MRTLLAALLLLASRAGAATLRLTAVCDGGSTEPSALDIELSSVVEGVPVFGLPDRPYGAGGMTRLVSNIIATDDRGPLPLVRREGEDLELRGARAAVGTVTLRYRARSVPVAEPGARFGLRHDATGIGGLGAHFLILPDTIAVQPTRITWGPSACGGEPLQTMSSFDEAPLESLGLASFFAGRPIQIAVDDGDLHLRAAWFGRPALDPQAATAWAARALATERGFFGDRDPAPYHLFVRVMPEMGERSNGMGQPSSCLVAIGPATPFGPRLRSNLAHEMLHRWIGLGVRFAGPEGSSFWFSEGFTVHYTRTLLFRAGLISPDEFLAELNDTATRHFANPRAAATNDEIRRRFFDDDALSVVPYTRGALYAAELDAAIRRHSSRSLDDVVRELGLREAPLSAFRDAIRRELGAPGVARFAAVIEHGARPEPPSDGFGPCFRRETRSIPLYELGFDGQAPTVKLVPGSAAARAGLRDGDRIVSVESPLLFPARPATVTVERAGKPVTVQYLPASARLREGFWWVRVTSVPDARCAP